MRKIFFAIRINQKTAAHFLPLYHRVVREYPALAFSPSNKWHITLHYVGDVTEKAFETIHENFKKIKLPHVSPIVLGGNPALGTFGNSVLFLHVKDTGTGLAELHHVLSEMVPVHVTRKFHPHVAWARNPRNISLREIIEKNVLNVEKEYILGQLILFESRSEKGKTIFVPRARKVLRLR